MPQDRIRIFDFLCSPMTGFFLILHSREMGTGLLEQIPLLLFQSILGIILLRLDRETIGVFGLMEYRKGQLQTAGALIQLD
jgi:hypothetical protein